MKAPEVHLPFPSVSFFAEPTGNANQAIRSKRMKHLTTFVKEYYFSNTVYIAFIMWNDGSAVRMKFDRGFPVDCESLNQNATSQTCGNKRVQNVEFLIYYKK